LLRKLLAFDPKDRPSAEEACHANDCLVNYIVPILMVC
jgi:hypothetical protein